MCTLSKAHFAFLCHKYRNLRITPPEKEVKIYCWTIATHRTWKDLVKSRRVSFSALVRHRLRPDGLTLSSQTSESWQHFSSQNPGAAPRQRRCTREHQYQRGAILALTASHLFLPHIGPSRVMVWWRDLDWTMNSVHINSIIPSSPTNIYFKSVCFLTQLQEKSQEPPPSNCTP